MASREVVQYIAVCDECGADDPSFELYGSEYDAENSEPPGWELQDDGALLCPECQD